MAWVSFHGAAWPTLASVAISPARTHALRDSVRAVRGCCARNRPVAAHSESSGLFEGGPYGWGEQRHQFRDVVEGLDVEHSLFDRALAVCGDHGASEAPVLVDDIGVGEHSVASASRVGNRFVTGSTVLEREAHSSGLSIVHRQLIEGAFVVRI